MHRGGSKEGKQPGSPPSGRGQARFQREVRRRRGDAIPQRPPQRPRRRRPVPWVWTFRRRGPRGTTARGDRGQAPARAPAKKEEGGVAALAPGERHGDTRRSRPLARRGSRLAPGQPFGWRSPGPWDHPSIQINWRAPIQSKNGLISLQLGRSVKSKNMCYGRARRRRASARSLSRRPTMTRPHHTGFFAAGFQKEASGPAKIDRPIQPTKRRQNSHKNAHNVFILSCIQSGACVFVVVACTSLRRINARRGQVCVGRSPCGSRADLLDFEHS